MMRERFSQHHDPVEIAARRQEATALADRGPARASAPAAHPVLQLQRLWGNQRVQRMMQPYATAPDETTTTEPPAPQEQGLFGEWPGFGEEQDDETPPEPTTEGNPLVGLTRGDGLDYGTWERRPRVELLQTKLNEKMLAGLNADGMFGPKTEEVLQEYQTSIGVLPQSTVDPVTADALMDRKGADKPPDDEKDDQKEPPEISLELEDKLDAVWLQYQIMLMSQNDALNRLEKDLGVPEEPTSLIAEILAEVTSAVLGQLFGPLLRDPIKEAITGDPSLPADDKNTLIRDGVDLIFDKAKESGDQEAAKQVNELTDVKTPAVDTFIESQRAAIKRASADAQETFLTVTKPELRKPSSSTVPAAEGATDLRMKRAQKLLDEVKARQEAAFDEQYQESTEKWALYQARAKLGTISPTPEDAAAGKEGTNMNMVEPETAGVLDLEIEIDPERPENEVKIESAQIAGLSEVVRNKLLRENPLIGALSFPRLAMTSAPLWGLRDREIMIAENEAGHVFDRDSTEAGRRWLEQKAMKKMGWLPDNPVAPTALEGARIVLQEEIDGKALKSVPGGLQGP